jgi:hypothetical protein
LETAMSARPSPLKSATATPLGPAPVAKGEPLAAAKEPVPLPRKTERLLAVPAIAPTSTRPSPFRSWVRTE